ncbi:MAG: arylsulfatase [Opitutales bacterium]
MMKKSFKFLAIAMGLCVAISSYAAKKPNIIFILADDMGYGDVSILNPEGKIPTPTLDKMATDGMIFTDAHTSSSVCTPSRYGILTGRYNWRSTLKGGVLSGYSKALIPQDRTTMASMLKASGYNTALIGKWHLGWDWAMQGNLDGANLNSLNSKKHKDINVDFSKPVTNSPKDKGFDYYYAICGSLDMPPYVYVENDMPTDTSNDMQQTKGGRAGPIASDLVLDQVVGNFIDRSCKYIKEQAKGNKPFFLYLPLTGPHTPIVPTKKFTGKSSLGSKYADFVIQIDKQLASIFKTLEDEGISDNTIVVFTADNGCSPAANINALLKKGHSPNADLRGNKADLYDGGHRVPCLVQWGNGIKKGSVANQTVCLTDFFATFADIAGYKLKDSEGEDSFDLISIFNNANAPQVRESTIHHSIDGDFAIRMGDWKLLVSASSSGWSYPHPTKDKADVAKLPSLQLYNMKDDKSEKTNLIAQHPEKAKEMLAQLRKEIEDGRSTAGAKQTNDVNGTWKQLEKVNKDYF